MGIQKHLISIFVILFLFNLVYAQNKTNIVLIPGPLTGEYKQIDLNELYDDSIEIQCTGATCISSSNDVLLGEGTVIISKAGTYILGGELNGQLNIAATKEDLIHLILRNATITSEFGPAIYGEKCKKVVITTEGQNTISDSTNYPEDASVDDINEDNEVEATENNNVTEKKNKSPNACIFIKNNLTFNGKGTLDVNANFNEGIRTKKDLKLVSGKINVVSKGNAIKAKQSISVKDAEITINSGKSGIKVTKDTEPEEGFIVIDGGNIVIKAIKDAIHAETHLTINDGIIKILESDEGLEGQMIDITGGDVLVNANNDGINAAKIRGKEKTKRDEILSESDSEEEFNIESITEIGVIDDTEDIDEISEVVEKPVTIDKEPTTVVNEPTTVVNEPTTVVNEPTTVVNEPTTVVNEPTTVVNEPTTVVNEPTTVVSEPTTIVEVSPTTTVKKPTKTFKIPTGTFKVSSGKNHKHDEDIYIRITGGKVDVRVDGADLDGIDSNGSIYIGGTAEVYADCVFGGAFGHVASVDSDGSNTIDAGTTALITGSGVYNKPKKTQQQIPTMSIEDVLKWFPNYTVEQAEQFIDSMKNFSMNPGNPGVVYDGSAPYDEPDTKDCLQPYVRAVIEQQPEGTPITIKDKEGKILIERKPRARYAVLFFTSPEIIEGETYTVIVGDDITETVTATVDTKRN